VVGQAEAAVQNGKAIFMRIKRQDSGGTMFENR